MFRQSSFEKKITMLLKEDGWMMDASDDLIHPCGLKIRYDGYSEYMTLASS